MPTYAHNVSQLSQRLAAPAGACRVDDINDIHADDGLCILPGPTRKGPAESAAARALIKAASEAKLVISTWCRGVRVLAAADVLRDKEGGHSDDQEIIEQAGGVFGRL